jgi:hypothetical protein
MIHKLFGLILYVFRVLGSVACHCLISQISHYLVDELKIGNKKGYKLVGGCHTIDLPNLEISIIYLSLWHNFSQKLIASYLIAQHSLYNSWIFHIRYTVGVLIQLVFQPNTKYQ